MDGEPAQQNSDSFVGVSKSRPHAMSSLLIGIVIFVVLIILGAVVLSAHFGEKSLGSPAPSAVSHNNISPSSNTTAAAHYINGGIGVGQIVFPIATNSSYVESATFHYDYVFSFKITQIRQGTSSAQLFTNLTDKAAPKIFVTPETQILIKDAAGNKNPGKLSDLHVGQSVWATAYYNPKVNSRWTITQILGFP